MVTMRSLGDDEGRERVQQRGLTGAGSARDDDVHARLDGGFEQFHHARRHAPCGPPGRRGISLSVRKTADGEQRAVHRQRRNDGVDARAVAQARVHHGRRFVDAAAHLATILSMMRSRCWSSRKADVGQFEQAAPLHVDLLVGVDQNVGDGGILQQRLQRPQAEHFVQHFVADLLFFERAEQRRLGVDQRDHRLAHFAAHALVVDGGQRFQVDLVHQLAVQGELQLLIFGLQRSLGLAAVLEQALFPTDLGRRRFGFKVWKHR